VAARVATIDLVDKAALVPPIGCPCASATASNIVRASAASAAVETL
jgi:hypothetical protein